MTRFLNPIYDQDFANPGARVEHTTRISRIPA